MGYSDWTWKLKCECAQVLNSLFKEPNFAPVFFYAPLGWFSLKSSNNTCSQQIIVDCKIQRLHCRVASFIDSSGVTILSAALTAAIQRLGWLRVVYAW